MLRAMWKNKRNMRIPFLILTVVIGVGLVGSFTIWSLPPEVLNPQPAAPAAEPSAAAAVQEQEMQFTTTIRQLEQATKLNPDNFDLWLQLGNNYYELGNFYFLTSGDPARGSQEFARAVAAYQKALELQPAKVDVRVDMATAAYLAGQSDVAEQNFQQALQDNPDHLIAHLNYGVFLSDVKGDPGAALEHWQKVVELDPEGLGQQAQALIEQTRQGTSDK